jgi:Tol biopolymer transport system component
VRAVRAGRYSRQNPSQNTAHIWLIDVDTGARRKLAAHDDRPYLDETPSYLADGRIAIQSNRTGRMEIWIIGVDGSATQLTRSARALPEDKRD